MTTRYTVFESDDVQFRTRRRVRRLAALAPTAITLTVLLVVLYRRDVLSLSVLSGGLATIWAGLSLIVAVQVRKLRRVVWCLKTSRTNLVGYDYARRRVVLNWDEVHHINLDKNGLCVIGTNRQRLLVPQDFAEYSALSHHVVARADALDLPLYLDGQPWQALEIYASFSSLTDQAAS